MALTRKGRRTIRFSSVVHLEAKRRVLISRHSSKINLRIWSLLQVIAWRGMHSHWQRSKIKIKWAFTEPTRASQWSTNWTRPISWGPLAKLCRECPYRRTPTARIQWSQLVTGHPVYNLCKKNRSSLFGRIQSKRRQALAAPRKANKIKWLQLGTIVQTRVTEVRTLSARSQD